MSLVLAAALSLVPVDAERMSDLMRGIAAVESDSGRITADGDLHRPICERSRGTYQVRPIAVRELVRVGMLRPMAGVSLTNCAGIRKWLAVPANNRKAAWLYLALMLQRSDFDEEAALAGYNGGLGCRTPTCLRYAGAVLAIASGEE